MDTFNTPLDLVRNRPVEIPNVCTRKDRLTVAVHWFQEHFSGEVLYAVKANPSPWVIDGLYAAGHRWFDVASLNEVKLIDERCPGATMAFLHPVKSRHAIRTAYHEYGVRIFALDCEDELKKIIEETGNASDLTLIIRLGVSNAGSVLPLAGKFGASTFDAPALIEKARRIADELGISFHVGSQCMDPMAYRQAMLEASRLIARAGVTVDIVDVGGGFPSIYPGLTPPPLQQYFDVIEETFEEMMVLENADLWCEPGRALVAEAASVLTRVELRKGDALYLNDGSYGMLFDATHAKWPFPMRVFRETGELTGEMSPFRLFGPTCDSIDSMPGPYDLPADIREGDVIEIGMLGAYGEAMATRFNGFGEYELAAMRDFPWQSLYVSNPQEQETGGAEIVAFPRTKRRRERMRRR
ncbi:type III PLP-dependent enzyme [Hyphobacterium sp. HN65]|uniref:ornithine decarboxylase n=1 Tax=Hyphobacterium lacteum TaxID=3116575 RepID=A0ABU7LNN2_9PROT|nr:type III PLP-dependent enzyme [Hyphobacterium sp. HN65]MEE2525536.1 type III PLP-dependent enzyme [Hyphobacterium sp. HN65]